MKDDGDSTDWIRVAVHFVVGVLIGAVLGFLWSGYSLEGISWPAVIGAALVIGILGAIFGDGFWKRFFEAFGWLVWW